MTCKHKDEYSAVCCNGDAKPYVADACPFENESDCKYAEPEPNYIPTDKALHDLASGSNRCVCCGAEIPEGRQVCAFCEADVERKDRSDG